MAWSTRQLAELAGTTVKTIRHYHEVGLLDEPERGSNGYKHYEVSHLVRLLRVRRLADLGVPLSQIVSVGNVASHPDEALQVLDAELAASIERLQRVRAELALILRHSAPTDLPAGFGAAASDMSEADRAIVMVYSRVLGASAMDEVRDMVASHNRTPEDAEFDALTDEADEATRQNLAERLAPEVRSLTDTYPWMKDPSSQAPRGAAFAESTIGQALVGLYNPAQLDVMIRVHTILQGDIDSPPTERSTP